MQERLPGDAAIERTGMYLQGELRSKRGCPGVQRVQKTYVDQLLYSLVCRSMLLLYIVLFCRHLMQEGCDFAFVQQGSPI